MKKFTLTATVSDDNTLYVESENEGFVAVELLGILELKRQDIMNQIADIEHKNVRFTRTVKDGDKTMTIEEATDDQT